MSDSDNSEYVVDDYVMPDTIRHTYGKEDPISDREAGSDSSGSDEEENDDSDVKNTQSVVNGNGSGVKGNGSAEEDDEEEQEVEPPRPNSRYILYVTNLSGETTRTMLEDFFGDCGSIKSIRIPKVRLGCYAFVEMQDFEGFKKGLKCRNKELDGRKIQVYEGSKNKKHTSAKNKNLKRKTQLTVLNNMKSRKINQE